MRSEDSELIERVLRLPPDARAALAGRLLESLEEEQPDINAEAAWALEIQRRDRDFDSGRVKGIPWSEARRRILGA